WPGSRASSCWPVSASRWRRSGPRSGRRSTPSCTSSEGPAVAGLSRRSLSSPALAASVLSIRPAPIPPSPPGRRAGPTSPRSLPAVLRADALRPPSPAPPGHGPPPATPGGRGGGGSPRSARAGGRRSPGRGGAAGGAAPVVSLALSLLADGRVAPTLIATARGRACLVGGVALEALAAVWMRRIVRCVH